MSVTTILLFASLLIPFQPVPTEVTAASTPSIDALHASAAFLPHKRVYREDGEALTDEQQAIADSFVANEICFKENGAVSLKYNFESKEEELLEDWQARTKRKNAVRWSHGYEGSTTTVENGLIISDSGSFLHRANWKSASIALDYLSTSGTRPQDLLATVFVYDKGKRVVGSHLGEQCVQLRGVRRTKECIPRKNTATVSHNRRIRFGHKLEKGVVHAQRDGSTTVDSGKSPKFTKKLGPGKAGLLWNGRIQGFVFSITIEGHLDPKWIEAVK